MTQAYEDDNAKRAKIKELRDAYAESLHHIGPGEGTPTHLLDAANAIERTLVSTPAGASPAQAPRTDKESLTVASPLDWQRTEWQGDDLKAYAMFVAATPFGSQSYVVWENGWWRGFGTGMGHYSESVDAAKAAAEADYCERMRLASERFGKAEGLTPEIGGKPSCGGSGEDGRDVATMESDRAQLQAALQPGGGPRMAWGECIERVERLARLSAQSQADAKALADVRAERDAMRTIVDKLTTAFGMLMSDSKRTSAGGIGGQTIDANLRGETHVVRFNGIRRGELQELLIDAAALAARPAGQGAVGEDKA